MEPPRVSLLSTLQKQIFLLLVCQLDLVSPSDWLPLDGHFFWVVYVALMLPFPAPLCSCLAWRKCPLFSVISSLQKIIQIERKYHSPYNGNSVRPEGVQLDVYMCSPGFTEPAEWDTCHSSA
jgi:hypothetical protein